MTEHLSTHADKMAAAVTYPLSSTLETLASDSPSVLTKGTSSQVEHISQRQPRTIADLIDARAEELPSKPIVSYPSKGIEYVDYTYGDLQAFSKNAASILSSSMTLRKASTEPEKVVAILGPSDFDYLINVLALSRLGYTVLFLSTRLSDAAYNALLTATDCSNIIYYPQFSETVETMRSSRPDLAAFERLKMQQYSQPTPYQSGQFDLEMENGKISWIIHSSGSTGLPKPIYQTHSAALRK
jgi:acyl-CoA synthetase (AMP-forming)/AMP-acid ligase II